MKGDIALSNFFQEAVSLFASPPPVDTYGYTVVNGTCSDDSAAILRKHSHWQWQRVLIVHTKTEQVRFWGAYFNYVCLREIMLKILLYDDTIRCVSGIP